MSLYSKDKVIWKYNGFEDDYLSAFQNGMFHNLPCYSCRYANEKRASDITIGDFWGIGKDIPFEKPGCKVSVIAVNTKKGGEFLQKCKGLCLEKRDYREAADGNTNLRRPSEKHPQIEEFWDEYKNNGIESAFDKTIGRQLKKMRFKNDIKRAVKSGVKRLIGR